MGATLRVLRTPEDAFEAIEGFDFLPRYLTIKDPETQTPMRVHYVDEGPRDAPVVLMLHGEPTWSYLYRHMIGPVVAEGLRAVVPDLIGFGRSDKPASKQDYSYAKHVAWMRLWLEALDLKNITLVCQDWGSLIGLRLLAEMPERFSAVVLSNGGLPAGQNGPAAFKVAPNGGCRLPRSRLMTRHSRTHAIRQARESSRHSCPSAPMSRCQIS
jgi:haloalkane dehalogenase